MKKEEMIKERVEKNLQVLQLLANNELNMSKEEKIRILNQYTGWGGLRDAIYIPSVYKELTLRKISKTRINVVILGRIKRKTQEVWLRRYWIYIQTI